MKHQMENSQRKSRENSREIAKNSPRKFFCIKPSHFWGIAESSDLEVKSVTGIWTWRERVFRETSCEIAVRWKMKQHPSGTFSTRQPSFSSPTATQIYMMLEMISSSSTSLPMWEKVSWEFKGRADVDGSFNSYSHGLLNVHAGDVSRCARDSCYQAQLTVSQTNYRS